MKQLRAPRKKIAGFLFTQPLPKEGSRIVPSQFVVSFEHESGKAGLYSILSGEAVLLEEDEHQFLSAFRSLEAPLPILQDDGSTQYKAFFSDAATLDIWKNYPHIRAKRGAISFDANNPLMVELCEKHFFVPEHVNEAKFYQDTHTLLRKLALKKQGYSSYTILSTMLCNARCAYCFEVGLRQFPMSDETAHEIADYILRTKSADTLKLSWFGGEPLLGARQIDIISERLIAEGVEIRANMISNGLLFSDAMVEKAKSTWGIKRVQITLDGTEENYNCIKNYYDTSVSPYQRVLVNIQRLLDAGIAVSVRINFVPELMDDYEKLVEELHARYQKNDLLQIYAYSLFDEEFCCFDGGTISEQEFFRLKNFDQLSTLIEAHTHYPSRPLSRFKTKMCMAESDKSVVIYADGRITNCEHCLPDRFFGNVRDGVVDTQLKETLTQDTGLMNSCKDCPFLPACTDYAHCPTHTNTSLMRLARDRRALRHLKAK